MDSEALRFDAEKARFERAEEEFYRRDKHARAQLMAINTLLETNGGLTDSIAALTADEELDGSVATSGQVATFGGNSLPAEPILKSDDAGGEDINVGGPTTRQRIREVMAGKKRMRMVEVVNAVLEGGSPARPDTVRSVLQAMTKSGEVKKVDLGVYRLVARRDDLELHLTSPAEGGALNE